MTQDTYTLSKSDIVELKSRWDKKSDDSEDTRQQQMIRQLRNSCAKTGTDRPLQMDLRGISLFHEDLSDLDLSGYDFSYANLSRTNLKGTILSYAVFHKASLEQAVLDECEFIGSDLSYANLNECSARQGGFGGANLSYASMINANLNDATLSRSTLTHSDLRAASLEGARLSEADLTEAIFTRANLVNSDLKQSNVANTNFELANMQGARFMGIRNFKKARWVGTDIRGLDMRGAYLVRRYIADENYLFEFKMTSRLHRVLYYLWWATSDCGRSLLRWFIWLLSATLFFAAIYAVVDIDYGDHVTWFSPVYFSFVTLTTLGYGDAVPASFAGQFFVTLQAVTGYMGLGGLLSILGNKMARRAE